MQKPCDLDFCTNSGSLVCTACKSARYCCREHQRAHWKAHKPSCKVMRHMDLPPKDADQTQGGGDGGGDESQAAKEFFNNSK